MGNIMIEDLCLIEAHFGAEAAVTPLEELTHRYGAGAVQEAVKAHMLELRSVFSSPTIYAVLTNAARASA
jgi:hypothetical protein